MADHLEILREKLKKAEARASRARKTLESAEKEVVDFSTALRVIEGLTAENNGSSVSESAAPTADRQNKIAQIVPTGAENSISPVDLFPAYTKASGDGISIDTFRTTIWRMKGKDYQVAGETYTIHGERHGYWKVPVSDDEDDFPFDPHEYDPVEAAEQSAAATGYLRDDDNEVPY